MCGIAGIISVNPKAVSEERLKSMTDMIAHRGPDGDGQWISESGKVGLGHRRLSIIDLSHEADQPMHYLDRYTIVFNGEIYNYLELKDVLIRQGYTFRTTSDTEVLAALYHRDKEKCLQLLDGMFAFVIYDKQEQNIFCARDRFGEKPFFYNYVPGQHFIFGSEMKALWAAGVEKKVNNRMLYNYLQRGLLQDPGNAAETFYMHCSRLPHSHYIKIDLGSLTLEIKKYYDIEWRHTDSGISEQQAEQRFHELFYTSVSRRLRSDVPVGSSLSGGLDSSLVVATIDRLRGANDPEQKTFSAVFPGFHKDESRFMKMVIDRTSVDPYFVTPDDEGMIRDLERIAYHQEEPFGSASIYVQYKVMELAKAHNVTVLLDGQGADELLAGYHGYYYSFFKELRNTDKRIYKSEWASYVNMHQDNGVNGVISYSNKQRLAESLPFLIRPFRAIYNKTLRPQKYKNFFDEDFMQQNRKGEIAGGSDPRSLNEALYNSTYRNGGLQELLRYADRNSMAHSREVRLPFLSHELVDFLFTLPASFKMREGWTKWIMRKTFSEELPEGICWRKDKIGYEPPQKSWMENPDFVQKLSDARAKLVNEGVLHKNIIAKEIVAENANDSTHNTWRQLMAAQII
ncbi:asparagine synthase (glutamine-hydrolyzing) [Taibaiella helva]|uniref:asparagine synthase (glutamine-hydrolyzing) n=1 Tax=Taibaiella helva TaxID=2301235 RepID=UPI000E584BA3|nr:asparagine synthase (glutamine-hydrolyzing) [Taibaiella helva]